MSASVAIKLQATFATFATFACYRLTMLLAHFVSSAAVCPYSIQSKGGFEMVGAYPAGYRWDMKYGKSQAEKHEAEANIRKVEVPTQDPVHGNEGPLLKHWKQQ